MRKILVIPARYNSSRFPGKPLARISGKECILRTFEVANQVQGLDAAYVATDDERIVDFCNKHDIPTLLTSRHCLNGSERVAEAIKMIETDQDDIIINLQGDAPLTPPWFIESIIERLEQNPDNKVVTPVIRCDMSAYARLVEDRQQGRVGGTTVVSDNHGQALYFSKEVIPYLSVVNKSTVNTVYHHVGLYGYRASCLSLYPQWGAGCLEIAEQLEQLRFIENRVAVHLEEVDCQGKFFWELNNPEDIDILEKMLMKNEAYSAT